MWEAGTGWRWTEAVDFCVTGDGQIPVIVVIDVPPVLLATPSKTVWRDHHRTLDKQFEQMAPYPNDETLATVELESGAAVEVIGTIDHIADDASRLEIRGRFRGIETDTAASPYRGAVRPDRQ